MNLTQRLLQKPKIKNVMHKMRKYEFKLVILSSKMIQTRDDLQIN